MTAQRVRQHLGAIVWHAREAIAEAAGSAFIPDLVHQIDVTGLDSAIDPGYVQEAAQRATHLVPDDADDDDEPDV